MTPAARIQTAIEILDAVSAGEPAERALTRWARGARHAGSKDRAAVRDHVFDVLRRWWSSAAVGRGKTGRARMIGYLSDTGLDPATLFTGGPYGPEPLAEGEATPGMPARLEALDCPAWIALRLEASLGEAFAPIMEALRIRAPVFLRVNTARGSLAEAQAALSDEGIETRPGPLSETALEVTANPRRIQQSAPYNAGLVELQDAASQAVVDMLPLDGAARILDYCAGGGGKALAMASRTKAAIHAHDISAARLADLPARAERAGARIEVVPPERLAGQVPYDLVLVDAPCSGSGAWRRSPEGKLRLTEERLADLTRTQDAVLEAALGHVAPGGVLAYATCSLLEVENGARVGAFLARTGLELLAERRLTPLDGGDGFYCAVMRRPASGR